MKRILVLAAAMTAAASIAWAGNSLEDSKMDKFIDKLMDKMTVEEKIGQLNLPVAPTDIVTGPAQESDIAGLISEGKIGGLFNLSDVKKVREIQELAVKNSRLHIPLIFGLDVVHGQKTVFPIPLGLSATWNMDAIEETARIAAVEASAQGINWVYSPMVDITHDARWGRVAEGAGEDPYLGSRIAEAYVRGYQGDLTSDDEVLACVKHYALYGAADAGRDYTASDMSRYRMFNYYMAPYKAAVDAGVASVMSAFQQVEGVPCALNEYLLTDVLREQWGFDGFVVADYDAVREATTHGLGNLQEVSARALKAGLDMDMVSGTFVGTLKKSLDEGLVSEADIDKACRRILEAKYILGLFDDPYRFCDDDSQEEKLFTPEHRAKARKIAAESFVLLKNEGNVLPLAKDARIAVVGMFADDSPNMLGSWTVGADIDSPVTILEGIRNAVDNPESVSYSRGSNLFFDPDMDSRALNHGKSVDRDSRSDNMLAAEAVEAAENADVVVAVLGEAAEMSGEAASRVNITIPDAQRTLLEKLVGTGKPVVLVLCTGRPLVLDWENENVDAILNIWFPGTEAGYAVADVLFGDENPSGKLTMSFPRHVGQMPFYYNEPNNGRPTGGEWRKYASSYMDTDWTALYPFGYGLSYTTFAYSTPEIEKESYILEHDGNGWSLDCPVKVKVTVTNTGDRAGAETVQLYVRDMAGSVGRPLRELKGFEKIYLNPGESRQVEFCLDAEALSFYNPALEQIVEPGEFTVMTGGSSADVQSVKFIVK